MLLTVAGDQVPVIPFGDVFPNTGAGSPEQKGAICAKFGVTVEVPQGTLQVKVAVAQGEVAEDNIIVAFCPGAIPNTS